jgi:hypothetical protein
LTFENPDSKYKKPDSKQGQLQVEGNEGVAATARKYRL